MDNTKIYKAISKTVEAHELAARTTIMTKDGPVIGEAGDFVIATPHEEDTEKVFDAETGTYKPKVVEVYEVVKRADFLAQYDVPDAKDAPKKKAHEFPGGLIERSDKPPIAPFVVKTDAPNPEHPTIKPVSNAFPGGPDTPTVPEPSPKTVTANSPEAVGEPRHAD